MDKHKDNEIRLGGSHLLNLSKEVVQMLETNPELLNAVYKEISEKLVHSYLLYTALPSQCAISLHASSALPLISSCSKS